MKAGTLTQAFAQRLCRIGLFAGTCGVIAGLATAVDTIWFLGHSVATQGTVVSIRAAQNNREHSVLYTPVFAFIAKDGQTYTVASDIGSNAPSFAAAQQVSVRYNPSEPAAAKIATAGQLWQFPLVFGSAGVIFSVMGWLLLRSERRRNPQFKPFGSLQRASHAQQ
jgi:hypothetical protein